jgi:hypothetical protein
MAIDGDFFDYVPVDPDPEAVQDHLTRREGGPVDVMGARRPKHLTNLEPLRRRTTRVLKNAVYTSQREVMQPGRTDLEKVSWQIAPEHNRMKILNLLLLFMMLNGVACQRMAAPAKPITKQIYWAEGPKKSHEYATHTAHFRLNEHEAVERLADRGLPRYRHLAVIGDWYFLYLFGSKDREHSLRGYYVNGITGAIEKREYDGELVGVSKPPMGKLHWTKVEVVAPPMTPQQLAKFKARIKREQQIHSAQ